MSTRRIVPVHCTQPVSRPGLQEKEAKDDIWCFSPIRIAQSSSPPSSEPRRSRYRTQQLSRNNPARHGGENIPTLPPSGSPSPRTRRHLDSDSGRTAKKRRVAIESKENIVAESSREGHETHDHTQARPRSDSRHRRDGPTKNRVSSGCSEEISEVGRIVDSINKMAAEAREDRKEVNDTLKKLLRELQRRL